MRSDQPRLRCGGPRGMCVSRAPPCTPASPALSPPPPPPHTPSVPGFRSRCMTPSSWQWLTTSTILRNISAAFFSVKLPASTMLSKSSPPAHSSMAMCTCSLSSWVLCEPWQQAAAWGGGGRFPPLQHAGACCGRNCCAPTPHHLVTHTHATLPARSPLLTLSVTTYGCPATRFMIATSACTSLTSSLHTSFALEMDFTAITSPVDFFSAVRTTPKAPLPICLSTLYTSSSLGSFGPLPRMLATCSSRALAGQGPSQGGYTPGLPPRAPPASPHRKRLPAVRLRHGGG